LSRQRPLAGHNEPNLHVQVGLNAAQPVRLYEVWWGEEG